MIKKGLSIEEAFKALNGRSTTVNKGEKRKNIALMKATKKLREGVEDVMPEEESKNKFELEV